MKHFQQTLKEFKVAIDKEIKHNFDIVIADAGKRDILVAEALEQTKKIALAGGKRIRGALLCYGYRGAGGKEKKKILKAAVAIEFVHLFLLIHDDIIDRGNLRHGQKTLHELFSRKYRKSSSDGEALHFGQSIAIIVGEMLYALANKIILEAGFDDEATNRALLKLQTVVATTIIGQAQDIAIENKKNVSEKDVLEMYENKTARYTFEGPLHVGFGLAGCSDKKTLKILSDYAVPLGIAFQIQDDILGVFGNEKKMGKSVASDIEEGKQSLMVVWARKFGKNDQVKKLNSILGKKNLTKKEIETFQKIIKETGADEYSKKIATQLLNRGKKEIEKAILLKGAKDFLLGLAQYLENREL